MISDKVCKTFRRDILNINTVRKIKSKGENVLGHSAPYPLELVQGLIEINTEYFNLAKENINDTM